MAMSFRKKILRRIFRSKMPGGRDRPALRFPSLMQTRQNALKGYLFLAFFPFPLASEASR